MDTLSLLFYAFAFVLVYAGFRVITAKNPVTAALHLVLAFFSASCVWMLLQAEFLSITLVLVYVGAVMVLFLFVVMMLDINIDAMRRGFWSHFPLAAVIGAVVAGELIAVMWAGFPSIATNAPTVAADVSNTRELGKLLYSAYLYPIQVAGFILLVAMLAAIALTLRQRKDSKFINPGDQVHVRASDRLVVVPMAAVTSAPVPPAANAEEGKA